MPVPTITLVIEGTYPWYRGGVSEWIAQYIRAFADYNFHIVQIATDPYLQPAISTALYDVPDQVQQFERISPPEYDLHWEVNANKWFKKYCKKLKSAFKTADIIHVANTGFAGWLGLQFAKELHKPLFLTEHALYWKEVQMGAVALECGYKVPNSRTGKKQMASLFKQIAKDIYAFSDEVISVSQCNIVEQKKMGGTDIRYIANGVDEHWLASEKSMKGDKVPVIGWVGRCAEMKNPLKFFDLVEAFENSEYANTRFIMMICDANEPQLQQKVQQRAQQFPQLQLICNQSAEEHLHKMDAMCITSHNESQPLVLFEAIAKKVLPMGWAAGDVTEKYGIIVPTHSSADKLVKAVMKLWEQPEQWNEEVDQRYQMVKNKHTWDTIFQQYRQIFQSYMTKPVIHGR